MSKKIAFGGAYSRMFTAVMPDLTKREYTLLMILVLATVFLGIYPAPILDGLGYAVSLLLYSFDIASDVVPNTQEFFSAGMRMLRSDAHIPRDTTPDFEQETEVPQEEPAELTAEERIEGDFDNCRGPMGTGEQAGEPVEPDYEGDHTFTESAPENYQPIENGATDTMCEACEQTLQHATDTFVTCITCDSS
jgi:hypothetical protein